MNSGIIFIAFYFFALCIVALTVYLIVIMHQSYLWLLLLTLLGMSPTITKTNENRE